MGSGSSRSSQVHSFQIGQNTESKTEEKPSSRKETEKIKASSTHQQLSPLYRSQSTNSTNSLKEDKRDNFVVKNQSEENKKESNQINGLKNFEAQENVKLLEKELTECQSQNLDLQERVQVLEERLEYLSSCHQIPEEGENYEETIKAKDQYISKMEKEHKSLQEEMAKLKLRHKRRVKNITKQLNEAKQETSIQMFELKDEITRLLEENGQLQEKCKGPIISEENVPDMGKMQIVLELSNQISEQNDRIAELESELKKKNDLITKSGISLKMEDYNKEKEDIDNLRRLSAGLSHFSKSNDHNFESNFKLTESEEDFRGVSGASRDSGIGSAGKNTRTEMKPSENVTKHFNVLSDSDWESEDLPDQVTPSKIHSAPVETQAIRSKLSSRESGATSKTLVDSEDDRWSVASMSSKGSRKSKKKSLSSKLRRENESTIRTPVPSKAFGENLDEFNDIPMYPSSSDLKYKKKKNSSFFLTQGSSPGGSDMSEPLQVT